MLGNFATYIWNITKLINYTIRGAAALGTDKFSRNTPTICKTTKLYNLEEK
jgi:hypothetical protein